MLPFITVCGRTVGSYALCSILGLCISGFVVCRLIKRHGVGVDDSILILLSVVGGIAAGGCLLYGATNIPTIITILQRPNALSHRDTLSALLSCFGGLVFYGGFLGGLLALRTATRRLTPLQRTAFTDIYAVATPLFHTFGRIGCFLGGCCYGIESRFGFLITDNPISPTVCGVVRFPVQLVEAGGNIVLFIILLYLFCRQRFTGRLLPLYLLSYPVMRFALEFLRGDTVRGIWGGLSTSQWISMFLITGTIVFLSLRKRHSAK